MNDDGDESKYTFLKDRDWSALDGELCRVTSFSPLGTTVEDGKVRTVGALRPYAAVTFQCSKLDARATGYIAHRLDFQHLWSAFKERTVSEDEEVLFIWTKKHYKKGMRLLSSAMPRLWVMIYPRGAFELLTGALEERASKEAISRGLMRAIIEWKPDVME